MALTPGEQLGPFSILSLLGKGGMGEVYKAHDPRLRRDVAIKTSATRFSERFDREARAIASLNHTNVCHIYDVGPNYIVMEYVDGETLAGPMTFDEALPVIRQLIDGIEAAHEKNVIHRDLKPANIKITSDGIVKILDFGLAKATEAATSDDPGESPTLTMGGTAAGTILGTAAYMSPEQAKGKLVDKRTDIFSFGVVLYEMLTGKNPFKGDGIVESLGAVLNKAPDWAPIPDRAQRLLKCCLQKDRKSRLASISDARLLLDEPVAVAAEPVTIIQKEPASKLPWLAAAVATLAALGVAGYFLTRPAPQPLLRKVALLAPEGSTFDSGGVPMISPDGRLLMLKANVNGVASIWVRDPNALSFRQLPGTEGVNLPFWSPDSKSIAFFADGKLKRVEMAGGPVLTLCPAQGIGRGGTWSADGVILFSPDGAGILRVPEAGGSPTPVTNLDTKNGVLVHRSPWFLPDGHHFLYTAVNSDPSKTAVYVGDADAQPGAQSKEVVVTVSSNVAYGWPGQLLYVREGTLMAQPFDATAGKTTGPAVPIAERIDSLTTAALAQFSVSQTGVLAYSSGGGGAFDNQVLTWMTSAGARGATVGRAGASDPVISVDGKRVAYTRSDPITAFAVFAFDLNRSNESRASTAISAEEPVWAPTGDRLAYSSAQFTIFVHQLGASSPDEQVASGGLQVADWSRDGNFLLAGKSDPVTRADIYVVPLTGDKKPYPYVNSGAAEGQPKLSPNGRWLAYRSDETGSPQVFVESFPKKGGKWQISMAGGNRPVWSRDGKELFFVDQGGNGMYAAEVRDTTAEGAFDWSPPKRLFDPNLGLDPGSYDVAPDGRFLMPQATGTGTNFSVTLVLDWHAALSRK